MAQQRSFERAVLDGDISAPTSWRVVNEVGDAIETQAAVVGVSRNEGGHPFSRISDFQISSEEQAQQVDTFDYFAEARAHGSYMGMEQEEDESDHDYRTRVAAALRNEGRIIEAHEVATGRRYDDPSNDEGHDPMVGIIGALAQGLAGRDFSRNDPQRQLDDDFVYGTYVREMPAQGDDMIGTMFDAFGPGTTMDILEAFSDRR